ncbi:30S ribosomal protein S16 [Chitinivibrio alkaliphilus]|uniref:Small ribosomal subunit protein bS16 n=1 Tax=Chitinivibrio alkaliphilus ACht1 TaxID=1313304 RepID=U7D4T7_9BACT|nr:30S ribosomal protein S16 [Chitinivibrio alkaliphilus]ERP30953.1 30S ribosomal protein S16 [Chitinivibrio alkaliphilus ACht1]
MIRIRLARHGRKKRPFYRIVAADQRRSVRGKFLDVLGVYNPVAEPKVFEIKEDKLAYWLNEGAEMSDTVASLVKKFKK